MNDPKDQSPIVQILHEDERLRIKKIILRCEEALMGLPQIPRTTGPVKGLQNIHQIIDNLEHRYIKS